MSSFRGKNCTSRLWLKPLFEAGVDECQRCVEHRISCSCHIYHNRCESIKFICNTEYKASTILAGIGSGLSEGCWGERSPGKHRIPTPARRREEWPETRAVESSVSKHSDRSKTNPDAVVQVAGMDDRCSALDHTVAAKIKVASAKRICSRF